MFNVALYVLLVDRDFSSVRVEMVSTFDQWRLRYTARHTALLLYETCDDLSQLLGKERYDRKLWIVEPVTPAAYPPV